MNIPSDVVVAYTAGILDGEGSVQINAITPGRGRTKRYFALTVSFASGAMDMLVFLRESWGGIGSIGSTKPRGKEKYRRSGWWRLYSAQAEALLVSVFPHLHIKKDHARVALEFRRFVAKRKGDLNAEMTAERRRLAMELRELNRRYGKCQARSSMDDAL